MSDLTRAALWAAAGGGAVWALSRWRNQDGHAELDDGADDEGDARAVAAPPRHARTAAPRTRAKARPLTRRFDVIFATHGMGLPVPYLRALAAMESGLDPRREGLIRVPRIVREDFNARHGTHFEPADLENPVVNVMVASAALREIIAGYARHHADVPNLREDWTNRRFVELLTLGWTAGFSETAGVGRVVRYLKERGRTDLTMVDVVRSAHAAGATHRLWAHPETVQWTRRVAELYVSELRRDVADGRAAWPAPLPELPPDPEPAPPPEPATSATATADAADLFDVGRPVPPDVPAIVSSGWSRQRAGRAHHAIDIPLPVGTPVWAIGDGVVVRVQPKATGPAGIWIAVQHPSGLTSRYLHLSRALVKPGQAVRRGQVIARSGNTGTSTGPHLHLDLRVPAELLATVEARIGTPRTGWGPEMAPFGFSIPGEAIVPVDGYKDAVVRDAEAAGIPLLRPPEPAVAMAEPVSRPDQVDASGTASSSELRNRGAALVYRPVGARGEPYPDWLRRLIGRSGVYVIRDRGTKEVLYVGESHTGRIYETLTRHLQEWRRWKGWWKGQYGEGHDPGLTYARDRVEVAVRVTSADRALDEETRLIRQLKPRDNLVGQVDEDAPF